MATIGELTAIAGAIAVIGGLLVEMLAIAAMVSYPLRRRLPMKSPIDLQSIGCWMILGGLPVYVLGRIIIEGW